MLIPKLFTTLKTYDRRQFGSDLAAGVVVGIVALPLSIAFAIASGVTPDRGLYAAVVAGFIISALGGSTGLHALTDVVRRSRRDGTLVLLSELQPQPLVTLRRSVLFDEIGEENLCATMDQGDRTRARGARGPAPPRPPKLAARGSRVGQRAKP